MYRARLQSRMQNTFCIFADFEYNSVVCYTGLCRVCMQVHMDFRAFACMKTNRERATETSIECCHHHRPVPLCVYPISVHGLYMLCYSVYALLLRTLSDRSAFAWLHVYLLVCTKMCMHMYCCLSLFRRLDFVGFVHHVWFRGFCMHASPTAV